MAVSTPVLLTSGGVAGNATSDTTASISPTGGSLLIAWVATRAGGGPQTHSISDTLTGTGAWTQLTDTVGDSRGSLFYAVAGPSPGTGTITFTYGGTQNRRSFIVAEVTGQDTATPVVGSNIVTGSGATLNISLPTSVDDGNLAYSAIGAHDSASITPGTGETELTEVSSGGGGEMRSQSQYGTDQTHDWSGLATSDQIAAIIEIQFGEVVVHDTDPITLGDAFDAVRQPIVHDADPIVLNDAVEKEMQKIFDDPNPIALNDAVETLLDKHQADQVTLSDAVQLTIQKVFDDPDVIVINDQENFEIFISEEEAFGLVDAVELVISLGITDIDHPDRCHWSKNTLYRNRRLGNNTRQYAIPYSNDD